MKGVDGPSTGIGGCVLVCLDTQFDFVEQGLHVQSHALQIAWQYDFVRAGGDDLSPGRFRSHVALVKDVFVDNAAKSAASVHRWTWLCHTVSSVRRITAPIQNTSIA